MERIRKSLRRVNWIGAPVSGRRCWAQRAARLEREIGILRAKGAHEAWSARLSDLLGELSWAKMMGDLEAVAAAVLPIVAGAALPIGD